MRGKTEDMDLHRVALNYAIRKGKIDPVPGIFANTAICMACGKENYVNTFGFCEKCWVRYSHLRESKNE